MKARLDELTASLEALLKEEEQSRRELSALKNNYPAEEEEEKKSSRTTAIQGVEAKLNDIMASKRRNEDTCRSIRE